MFRDVKNRDHGQTFDDAELVWDYCFSGVRREADGTIVHTGTALPAENDAVAVAAVAGCRRAWVNGEIRSMAGAAFLWQKLKYHGLQGKELVRGEYLMTPLSFLAETVNATLDSEDNNRSCTLTLPDDTEVQFAQGSIGAVLNNRIVSMDCEAVLREGELYVSMAWFLRNVAGLQVSCSRDGVYATDHETRLSTHITRLLRDVLKN